MIECANTIVTLECNVLTGLPTILLGNEDVVESGNKELVAGAVEVNIVFLHSKLTVEYVFEEGYFENFTDVNPATIGFIPTAKTTLGFTILLDVAPPTDNYVFHWKVRVVS